MPPVVIASLNVDATYWAVGVSDGYGEVQIGSPADIKWKFELVTVNSLNPNGVVSKSDAIAFIDTTVTVGSVLRAGKVADLPGTPDNLYEVMSYNELTDIRGIDVGRWVELNNWNKALPTVV